MNRDWPKERIQLSAELDGMPYDKEGILANEDANWVRFLKHSDKVIPYFKNHQEIFDYAFGKGYVGVGVLDVGTGIGVFLENHLTKHFLPPRMGVDVAHTTIPEHGWFDRVLNASDILKTFGERAFDHVQCIETLEHMDSAAAVDVAAQMLKVSRKTCLITSMGLNHHMGDLNIKAIEKNSFLDYKGQPNIESLMELGYNVRLLGNYQVLAWHSK